ncbi:MAG: methyltransferase domain-containing protein [Gallintestinimicrobium sp.]
MHEPGWIETGCAEKLPYPDQTADIILMECSCSKAVDPAAALREVYWVLKPEGWLLMSDMYARKKELFLDGMLGRLESAKTIRDLAGGGGICDCKDAGRVLGTLAEWIGQQIFDGNLNPSARRWGRNGRF